MLILKQTYIDVFFKTDSNKNIMTDENNNHFVSLSCFQLFNSKGKRFKNKFESIKLFGNIEMLEELLSRVSANMKVKIEICNCELYLKPIKSAAQAYLSCKEWNFDKNKFKLCKTLPIKLSAKQPEPPLAVVQNIISDTAQAEEIKLLGDGIDLP